MKYNFEKYCKDYENIENYQKAKADDFKNWEVHHRLETHTSDGERRLVDITRKELQALGMYWHRPSSELIFLAKSEHRSLHKPSEETKKKLSEANKGKPKSEETKKKLSEAHKGKPKSEEHKNKLSETHKGHLVSEETKKKIGAAKKGTHWYNNGKINIRAKQCPDGFIPGKLLIK